MIDSIGIIREDSRSRFPLQTPRSPAGRFCYALAGWPFPAFCVQTSFVQENILRPAFSCTSLTDLADCRPDSERLEQKTPEGSVFRCTNEICTSQYQLHRTFSPGRDRPWCRWGRETGIVSSGDRARSVTVLRSDLYNFIVGGDAIPGTGRERGILGRLHPGGKGASGRCLYGQIIPDAVHASHQGMDYGMRLAQGKAKDLRGQGDGAVLQLLPDRNQLTLKLFRGL